MELKSDARCTVDGQWRRIVVAFNASIKDFTGMSSAYKLPPIVVEVLS